MGATCSKQGSGLDGYGAGSGGGLVGEYGVVGGVLLRQDPYAATGGIPDPEIYDLLRRSVNLTQPSPPPSSSSSRMPSAKSPFRPLKATFNQNRDASNNGGQFHLLYKHQQQQLHQLTNFSMTNANNSKAKSIVTTSAIPDPLAISQQQQPQRFPTRLVMRRHPVRTSSEEGVSGTHIYAVRWTEAPTKSLRRTIPDHANHHRPEQYPQRGVGGGGGASKKKKKSADPSSTLLTGPTATSTNVLRSPVSNVTFTTSSSEDGFDIITGTTTTTTVSTNSMMNSPLNGTGMQTPGLVGISGTGAALNRQLEDRRNATLPSAAAVATAATTNAASPATYSVGYNSTVAAGAAADTTGEVSDDMDGDAIADDLSASSSSTTSSCALSVDNLFRAAAMAAPPKRKVADWVAVSVEHSIYVADVGLSVAECNHIVAVTEQQCRGQYAAYTYAKQTLGCREYPPLAVAVQGAVHTVVSAIMEQQEQSQQRYEYNDCSDSTTSSSVANKVQLVLDDREPHMVKYDVTKKERQKLDMHTDKSEWTFLIAVSNGAGVDYTGGGTYFECLDATVHVQRGHALIFPGKLRHCGQRITAGLRFLLVGFLVDKTPKPPVTNAGNATTVTTSSGYMEIDDMHKYACNIP